jgi:hypothetical protein
VKIIPLTLAFQEEYRPSIGQVNPIREWSTATIDSEGNPNLIPQFTNSFELNYTRKQK